MSVIPALIIIVAVVVVFMVWMRNRRPLQRESSYEEPGAMTKDEMRVARESVFSETMAKAKRSPDISKNRFVVTECHSDHGEFTVYPNALSAQVAFNQRMRSGGSLALVVSKTGKIIRRHN